ncbi:hypothetical protein [Kocuria tytonis]|uniref:hypothetical protein n=1 Tax=Kocuria tytonis TaxID=2054280 RepID=UPI001F15CB8B|nr:hypothetical protein [Kocuria tytonis]
MRFFRHVRVPAATVATAVALALSAGSPAAAAPPQPRLAPPQPHQALSQPHQAPVPAAQAALPPTTYSQSFTAAGMTSSYHVYTAGVDPSKAVGVVFYLGGDYGSTRETWVHNPGGPHLTAMAADARSKNMVLVVPISPDHDATGDGITWWEDADGNGDWFRALQDSLVTRYGLDTSRVWLTGYSGGAEFITYELLADRQGWIRGGGATIIGGGGSSGMQTAPGAAVRSLPLSWYVGSEDGAGSTNPPTWSASKTADQGRKLRTGRLHPHVPHHAARAGPRRL